MSASRDKSQKVTFVYSNLYDIYQKGKTAASRAGDAVASATEAARELAGTTTSSGLHTAQVIKTSDLNDSPFAAVRVQAYNPVELLTKRVRKPESIGGPAATSSNPAILSLKDNLRQLNDLHSRLRFMIQELEDLVKE